MNFFLLSLIKAGLVAAVLMTTLAYLQWIERKVIAHIQVRVGPHRVGPHGLLQPLADVIKLLTKEDLVPAHVNKFFYLLAPFMAVMLSLISISVIPFGPAVEVFGVKTFLELTNLNIAVLLLLGISGVSVYGVALAGWSSNNKYALMGSLRAAAQMVSYELPMALAIASPLLLLNTLNLREIGDAQAGYYLGFIPRWTIFQLPMPQILAFIAFLIAAFAETNRIPFDLPEAETELVAGFHTEYSSMKFAAFFMAEYANMVTICSLATVLFLGAWHPILPETLGSNFVPSLVFAVGGVIAIYHGASPATRKRDRLSLTAFGAAFLLLAGVWAVPLLQPVLVPVFWFAAKTGLLLFAFIWVRGTLPRFRYDQLMHFAWGFLFPVSIVHLFVTGLLVALQ